MIEFIAIVCLLVVARRLRRAAPPLREIDVHIYHHFPDDGPGEREDDEVAAIEHAVLAAGSVKSGDVIPFRRKIL